MTALTECTTVLTYSDYGDSLSDIVCPNVVVLEESKHYGPHNGFGWTHILEEEKDTHRFFNYYKENMEDQLGHELSDEEIKELEQNLEQKILDDMENTLRYGNLNEMPERNSVVYEFGGIEVVVSTDSKNMGSIITAHPGD